MWIALAVVAVAGWAAYKFLYTPRQAQKAAPVVSVKTARIAAGPLERVLRLSGITSTRNYASVTVPIMRGAEGGREMILIKLIGGGSRVKKADLLAQIDAQAMLDHIDDCNAAVDQAESDIKKLKAQQAVDLENLQQTLRQDSAQVDKAKLDFGAREVRTVIDQEILKLAVEEADATYKEDQANLPLKEVSQNADVRVLEIAQRRQVKYRDRMLLDLKRFQFNAPMNGLAVVQTFFRNGELAQIQLGDSVYSGQTFMRVVDTSTMQVETTANQAECNQLRIGMPARIIFDAFPGLQLNGKIYSVGAMGLRGWRENYYVRNVPVRVAIDGEDLRLIPDLSAAADVVLEHKDNAVQVPAEALQAENGKNVVFVKRGARFERRQVQLGLQSWTHAEVLAGLQPGEEVALEQVPSSLLAAE